jgi:hypothetical protein
LWAAENLEGYDFGMYTRTPCRTLHGEAYR